MEHGDFTKLAKDYSHRPGYSREVIKAISRYIGATREGFIIAEVGAGTGKLTEILIEMGLKGYAVEPNDAMREEGIDALGQHREIVWQKGSAEETGLPGQSADWVLMASSFHWAETEIALKEFHRVLRPGGHFTALWNPRDLEKNALQKQIEEMIYTIAPNIERVSSGSRKHLEGVEEQLTSTGHFKGVVFVEAAHQEVMSKERYLGVWRSVNDIQVQAGPEKFSRIMTEIERIIAPLDEIVVPYKTRAWTAGVCR
jgi:ubiquinone/menaquinone biosynthesis C-methylase UbiE